MQSPMARSSASGKFRKVRPPFGRSKAALSRFTLHCCCLEQKRSARQSNGSGDLFPLQAVSKDHPANAAGSTDNQPPSPCQKVSEMRRRALCSWLLLLLLERRMRHRCGCQRCLLANARRAWTRQGQGSCSVSAVRERHKHVFSTW